MNKQIILNKKKTTLIASVLFVVAGVSLIMLTSNKLSQTYLPL